MLKGGGHERGDFWGAASTGALGGRGGGYVKIGGWDVRDGVQFLCG